MSWFVLLKTRATKSHQLTEFNKVIIICFLTCSAFHQREKSSTLFDKVIYCNISLPWHSYIGLGFLKSNLISASNLQKNEKIFLWLPTFFCFWQLHYFLWCCINLQAHSGRFCRLVQNLLLLLLSLCILTLEIWNKSIILCYNRFW